ncbi:acyltransferase family protein [Cellulomonas biazotea]|uniref:Acyltransferase n=1 Tax=Cellulomonas biazotea TaxID=1709 RepID=A0A402DQ80_9CELL|nr:acyltransferase [Cellulomonas biazotea]GCE76275.1 acyltransferase [Cellulomonas biazotea]
MTSAVVEPVTELLAERETGVAPTSPGRDRIEFVHLLRGAAAAAVVWAHLSGFWLYANERSWVVQQLWAQYVVVPFHLFQNAGHLGVVVFFLISGYIISYTSERETRREFAVKRALRIFPMLAVAVLVTGVALAAARANGIDTLPGMVHGTPVDYLKAVFVLDQLTGTTFVLGSTWTLAIELTFYTLVLLLIPMSRRDPVRSTWVMVGVWAVVTPVVIATPSLKYLSTTCVYLAFLFVGRTFYLQAKGRASTSVSIGIVATTGLLYVLFYTVAFPGELMTPSVEPAASYVLAIVVFLATSRARITRLWRPFRVLGDISYSLYLLHLPVGMLAITLLDRAGLPFTVAFVLGVTASLVSSWVTYRWVERPSQRLARTMLRRRPRPAPAP